MLYTKVNFIDATGYTYCWDRYYRQKILRGSATDDAVECCADLNIPFFVDVRNKKLVFWFVRVDDEGYPEIARCTEREFATILAGISAGGMYCPECGTVHWPDGVPPPF
ncbi:hypothetical protein ABTU19_005002 [Escherichia coli]|nr:hypothetical protein [Escherichia coli]HAG7087596.1 hypothetical protein [Escherichia coli O157]EER2306882.1 hypothetical protein [Escherichia coli]EEW0730946.1 hypothetical protein [Escherichia coli]EEW9375695.1 hypothetical protein [Escherichia coli]